MSELRAWDGKRMMVIDCIDFAGTVIRKGEPSATFRGESGCWPLDVLVIEEYIGANDHRGVRIFEGDILDSNPEEYPDDTPCPYVVVFEDGAYRAKRHGFPDGTPGPVMSKSYISCCHDVIIGNIHQNSGLLENTKK